VLQWFEIFGPDINLVTIAIYYSNFTLDPSPSEL